MNNSIDLLKTTKVKYYNTLYLIALGITLKQYNVKKDKIEIK